MRIRLATVIWGQRFTDIFLRVTVRSLLAEGNLRSLAARHRVNYTIGTTQEDANVMLASPQFQQLKAAVPVEFALFGTSEIDAKNPSSHWTLWHRSAEKARHNREILFFIIPDMLYGTGTLQRWGELFERGYHAIWTSAPQVVLESTMDELETRFPPADGAPIAVDEGEAHRLFIRHMHPQMICMFRDSRRWIQHPEICYREIPGEGFAMRAMASHPFCIDLAKFTTTDAFSPCESLESIAFDKSTGICLEPMLKYVHLHYRPASMDDVRLSNLGSWIDWFASPGDILEGYRHTYQFRWKEQLSKKALRGAEVALGFYACQVRLTGSIYRAMRHMRGLGCRLATQIVAFAHYEARLRRHWRIKGPVTVFVPNDAALEAFGRNVINNLLLPGNEKNLIKAIMAHVFPGTIHLNLGDTLTPINGKTGVIKGSDGAAFSIETRQLTQPVRVVSGAIQADDCTIYVVDYPLCSKQHLGEIPRSAIPNRWAVIPQRLFRPTLPPITKAEAVTPPPAPTPENDTKPLPEPVHSQGGISTTLQNYLLKLRSVPGLSRLAALASAVHERLERRRAAQIAAEPIPPPAFPAAPPPPPTGPAEPRIDELGTLEAAQVMLNLAEIFRFYHAKTAPWGADSPPKKMIEDCLAKSGITPDSIIVELEKLTVQAPNFAEAWLELGYAYLDRQDYAKAGTCFDKCYVAVTSLPEPGSRLRCGALAAWAKAEVLEAQSYLQDAADAYAKAFQIAPGSSLMHIRYARLLRRLDKLNEALAEFDAGMDTDVMPFALVKTPHDFDATVANLVKRFGREKDSQQNFASIDSVESVKRQAPATPIRVGKTKQS